MPSGRKNRIMIACVTFETSKVVEPALYYEVNRAHIIHYVKDPDSESGMVYDSFRRRVCERLRDESPREVELVMHNERVSDFSVMLRTVLSIIQAENRGEEGCEIYVNISSGSPECRVYTDRAWRSVLTRQPTSSSVRPSLSMSW